MEGAGVSPGPPRTGTEPRGEGTLVEAAAAPWAWAPGRWLFPACSLPKAKAKRWKRRHLPPPRARWREGSRWKDFHQAADQRETATSADQLLKRGPCGPAGSPPRAGPGRVCSSCIINFVLFPAKAATRLKVRGRDWAAASQIDRLHSCAGSVSCLVTPQQSNYHCGMHNGLINN